MALGFVCGLAYQLCQKLCQPLCQPPPLPQPPLPQLCQFGQPPFLQPPLPQPICQRPQPPLPHQAGAAMASPSCGSAAEPAISETPLRIDCRRLATLSPLGRGVATL
jgi:hypothetical protein